MINDERTAGMAVWILLGIELLCVAVLLAGVAVLSVPTAMILGGALGVLACERWNVPTRKART